MGDKRPPRTPRLGREPLDEAQPLGQVLDRRLAALHQEIAEIHLRKARLRETGSAPDQRPATDETLRIREACKRMGWTYSWAVRRWEKLGGYKDLDGRLKIRCDVLSRYPHTKTPATSGH